LIAVPQIPALLPISKVKSYIRSECIRQGYALPARFDRVRVSLREAYIHREFADLLHIAEKKGGRCLSSNYLGATHKMKWQCQRDHVWEATPANIRRGTWCPVCAGIVRSSISALQEFARQHGLRCVSQRYCGANHRYKWRCRRGHTWTEYAASIKAGVTCPVCRETAFEQHRLAFYRSAARAKGGKCLSDRYSDSFTKLKWKCKYGHRWSAEPTSVQQGHWCPTCAIATRANSKGLSMPAMRRMAASRSGRCLSRTYLGAKASLKWICRHKHTFFEKPFRVRAGIWCPVCRREGEP
jgi:hypothetical protein